MSCRAIKVSVAAASILTFAVAGLGARTQTADEVFANARKALFEQGPRAALPEFERALALYREKSDRHGEAVTLGAIGNCYERLADYPRALDYLRRALTMKQELGDRLEEGKTLGNIGLVFWDMADYPKAVDHLSRSLQIAREVGDKQLEGTTLNNLGLISDEQGDYRHALELYERALELHRASHFERGESDTLGNIGGDYLLLGQYREATKYYEQALELDERLNLKPAASLDLGNLALCRLGLGQPQEAVRTFDRAMALAREAGTEKDEADWHKGKGSALLRLGKYAEAREEYGMALEVYERAGLKRELIEALNDDGTLHVRLGDSASAETDFRRAIELSRSIGHPRGVTENLMSLGELEWRRHRYEQAAALYGETFERAKQVDDKASMAASLVQLALALRDLGRPEEGVPKAQQALEIARSASAALLEAEALYALGELARKRSDGRKALEHYGAGDEIARRAGDTELTWRLAYGKGQALETLGQNDEAVAAYRQAIETIEEVRSQLREERFQAGYIEDKYQVYVSLVRLLLKMGKIGEAFTYTEKLRARSYSDLINRSLPQESEKEAELRARIRQLQRAIEQEQAKPSAEKKRNALELYSTELVVAEREYQAILDDLRGTHPAYATALALAVPPTERVQAELPADSALIEYVVGEDGVAIFALTTTDLRATTVAIRAENLRSKIELFRDLLTRERGNDWLKPAESLYQLLIAPIEQAGWLKGITRLYLVPHTVLHYLPFAALVHPGSGGGRFLVEDYEVAYLAAASALVYGAKREDPKPSLFVLAPAQSGLQFAQQEARAVGALFPDDRLVLVGRQATKSAFQRQAARYQIIHLATHGFFDKFNPVFSGVQLEPEAHEDGRLQVYEILRLHLEARLVTLSACETALESGYFVEYPAGDDFVGLSRAFLFAGSSAVLASLWEVDDRSTSQLMRAFYRGLQKTEGAAALRQAQLALLKPGSRYRRPYFWAPFVLMGVTK